MLLATERYAIYARYSTKLQNGDSIDDQLRTCRGYANKIGLKEAVVYRDEAMSGATDDRAAFRRMRDAALDPKHVRKFDTILVADLSRLSRDLWLLGRTIFEEFLPAGVVVIDCMTGTRSDGPGARTSFAAVGLANDALLQSVRERTHMALEGRARDGFSAGGSCFGYRTEKTASTSGRSRSGVVVDPAQAEVVRRVFRWYREGQGTKAIADRLNREGLRAPYDGRKHKTNGEGWGHTTVRAILINRRYLGELVWNKRKFVRVPGKKNRKAVLRPEADWIRVQRDDLAIVSAEEFQEVAEKMRRRHSGGAGPGRPLGSGTKGPHLLSGILYCGTCGNAMGTVSKGKYGCLRSASRGYSTERGCKNRLPVPAVSIEAAVLREIRRVIENAGLWRPMVIEVMRRVHVATYANEDLAHIDLELQKTRTRIANLTEVMAEGGRASQSLLGKLESEEERARALENQLRTSRSLIRGPRVSQEAVVGAFERLANIDGEDRALANTTLRAYLGRVIMTPNENGPERGYRASGAIDVFVPLALHRENSSCGGRI